jgi:hypothetical protein
MQGSRKATEATKEGAGAAKGIIKQKRTRRSVPLIHKKPGKTPKTKAITRNRRTNSEETTEQNA